MIADKNLCGKSQILIFITDEDIHFFVLCGTKLTPQVWVKCANSHRVRYGSMVDNLF